MLNGNDRHKKNRPMFARLKKDEKNQHTHNEKKSEESDIKANKMVSF